MAKERSATEHCKAEWHEGVANVKNKNDPIAYGPIASPATQSGRLRGCCGQHQCQREQGEHLFLGGELSDEIDVGLTAAALVGMVLVAALDWKAFQPERSLDDVHAALSRLLQGRVSGIG